MRWILLFSISKKSLVPSSMVFIFTVVLALIVIIVDFLRRQRYDDRTSLSGNKRVGYAIAYKHVSKRCLKVIEAVDNECVVYRDTAGKPQPAQRWHVLESYCSTLRCPDRS